MSPYTLLQLPSTLRACIFAFALVVAASPNDPSSSPIASTNLICHTDNPADCYPAVFSPTKHFQIVHDDQSIPPGLHVRMNLATGLKEARLNIPGPENDGEAAVVVIDNTHHEGGVDDAEHTRQGGNDFFVQDGQEDHGLFEFMPDNVPSGGQPGTDLPVLISRVSSALERGGQLASAEDMDELAELAYDVELGTTLMSDPRLTTALLVLVDTANFDSQSHGIERAATILGNALHNNPTALKSLMASEGQNSRSPTIVATQRLGGMLSHSGGLQSKEEFHVANRLLFLLSQLCQDQAELHRFLEQDGLALLHRWLVSPPAESAEREKGRVKVRTANLLADHATAVAKVVQRGKADRSQLITVCEDFRIDPSIRYDTTSVEYTSSQAASEALRAAMGGDCSN